MIPTLDGPRFRAIRLLLLADPPSIIARIIFCLPDGG